MPMYENSKGNREMLLPNVTIWFEIIKKLSKENVGILCNHKVIRSCSKA